MTHDETIERGSGNITEAAKLMGIRQPKLCALLKGSFANVTIDRLVRYLNRLGQKVHVTVERRQVG